MEEKIKISAIIKSSQDDERLIEALESIKCFDEITIVDEYSCADIEQIAKEYKAKLIYAQKNDSSDAFNQALIESRNEWVFVISEDEIIPKDLSFEIKNYISNPKKNKNCVSFSKKYFYLNKEIKAGREDGVLALFKKGCAEFLENSSNLKIKCAKTHKIKPQKNKNTSILKFEKDDIFKSLGLILDKNKILNKNSKKTSYSLFFAPIQTFIRYYIFKGAIFEGKRGLIFSSKKYIDRFILEASAFEREKKNDIR